MNHPEKTVKNAEPSAASKLIKRKEVKKPFVERMKGKVPFSWLKVDATASESLAK